MGLANYYRRYINNFASIAQPLNSLLAKDIPFVWNDHADLAFKRLKELLTSQPILTCPNFGKKFTLCTDASGTGLGAVLEQEGQVVAYYSRGAVLEQEGQVVAYYSRGLRNAERNYSTIELECLAIVESVKRFRHYLLGREFVVVTDHKPLEWLAKQNSVGRLWRWAVMLQEFDFVIQYRPGSTNDNADTLSRSTPNNSDDPDPNPNASHEEVHCALTGISRLPTMEEIRINQLNDPILGKVLYELEVIPISQHFLASEWNQTELKRYNQIRFQMQLVNGVVTRNYKIQPFSNLQTAIIAPKVVHRNLLCQAHDNAGHQGTERTLSHLKNLAYWVNMSSDVSEYVRSCETCQKAKLSLPTKAPLINTPIGRTMQLLQVDVLEVPVSSKGNRYLLVVEDAFTKWLECYPMSNQKSETITEILIEIFSRYGIPEFLHSDQGRNFESQLLKETCRALGIRKTHTTPYHPQGNALVERSNRTVLQMLRCYVERNEDWEKYLQLVLFAYRTSKHSSTGVSSFQLMYGRESPNISYLPPLPGYEPVLDKINICWWLH